jgi:hypothetical protein
VAVQGDGWADGLQAGPRLPAEAGCGFFKRAIGTSMGICDHLSVRRTPVLGFELAINESMRWPELDVVPSLGDNREFDLCAIAEVVAVIGEALAVVLFLAAIGKGTKSDLQSPELARAQSARALCLGSLIQRRELLHDLLPQQKAVLRHRGLKSESSTSSSRSQPIWAAASSSGIEG